MSRAGGWSAGGTLAAVVAVLVLGAGPVAAGDAWGGRRWDMVENQIAARGLTDRRLLDALRTVPRHLFVPEVLRDRAYDDSPLPIGYGQTISQPYIVALMTSLLHLRRRDRVLEIGTGSGYHAAVVSRLAGSVYTIEIVEPLARRAEATLAELGYDNVHVRVGDGYRGWPEEAPFDAILLTAAPPEIPRPLLDQLAVGGKLVAPVGIEQQELEVVTRTKRGLSTRSVTAVRFVPMTGRAQNGRRTLPDHRDLGPPN